MGTEVIEVNLLLGESDKMALQLLSFATMALHRSSASTRLEIVAQLTSIGAARCWDPVELIAFALLGSVHLVRSVIFCFIHAIGIVHGELF